MNNIFKTIFMITNTTTKVLSFPSNKTSVFETLTLSREKNADIANIASDWKRVGNDMWKAVLDYDRSITRKGL
ncbi:hypothetical protein [Weissella confusa]|uniref:hypothetical protein n=1 Tax=Weissella confusa TaxID=1583 RepID=UPI00223A9F8C|nr:hypothetical protein [Weissella confusa]